MTPNRFAAGLIAGVAATIACDPPADQHPNGHGAPSSAPAVVVPAGARAHEHGAEGHGALAAPPGYAAIEIDPARSAAMGLATARVEERAFRRTIRTSGVVTLDETRTSHVHAKVRGWIDRVTADFVGKQVRAGSPLCTIYSQEVYAAQLEYLSVFEQAGAARQSTGPFAEAQRDAGQKLMAAARRRLALWDVPAAEIARLEQTRRPQRTFALVAPRTGVVVSKQAIAGMFVDPGTELYVVSDIARLWLLADVYGADVPWVRVGASAKLRIEGMDAGEREAKVAFLPPTIEESTRTLKARFELDNSDGRMRPGAFATVEMSVDLGSSLAIPENGVIHAGDRAIAFVVEGTKIEPRAVELGPVVDGYHRVERGVHAGESVAVGAQFLIDSESRLRATSAPGAAHAGH